MGRRPCCAKEGLDRGAWTAKEDRILTDYIEIHGGGKWRDLPQRAGLKRCGKSCRLRWLNYLRPDIKRGNISEEEEQLIVRLHKLLGNRWSLIAGRLPGRTDNEIKNYWNTNLSKKLQGEKTQKSIKQSKENEEKESALNSSVAIKPGSVGMEPHRAIRTKAAKCTEVVIPQQFHNQGVINNEPLYTLGCDLPLSASPFGDDDSTDLFMDLDISDLLISDVLNLEIHGENKIIDDDNGVDGDHGGKNVLFDFDLPIPAGDTVPDDCTGEGILDDWRISDPLQPSEDLGNNTLSSLFD